MSKYRETPCKYYVSHEECSKGRGAEHKTYCQHCNKYFPGAKVRYINKKKLTTKSSEEKLLSDMKSTTGITVLVMLFRLNKNIFCYILVIVELLQ